MSKMRTRPPLFASDAPNGDQQAAERSNQIPSATRIGYTLPQDSHPSANSS